MEKRLKHIYDTLDENKGEWSDKFEKSQKEAGIEAYDEIVNRTKNREIYKRET